MCFGCYVNTCGVKPGRPNDLRSVKPEDVAWAEVTDAMNVALSAVSDLYEVAGAGGPLHVEVDDANVDDHFFEKPPDEWEAGVIAHGWYSAGDEALAAGRKAYEALRPLSESERATVLAMHDGIPVT